INYSAGDNLISQTLDLTGLNHTDEIMGFGLVFRHGAYGNYSFNGKIKVDYVLLGDAVTETLAPNLNILTVGDNKSINAGGLVVASNTQLLVTGASPDSLGHHDLLKIENTGPAVLTISS